MANFSKDTVLDMLKDIRFQLWLNDIPSPTVPEYVEHHEQITELIKFVDKLIMNVAKEGAEQECRQSDVTAKSAALRSGMEQEGR